MSKSNENLERALRQAKVSNQIEGKEVTDDHIELVRARLTEQITEEEFHEEVWRRVNQKHKDKN